MIKHSVSATFKKSIIKVPALLCVIACIFFLLGCVDQSDSNASDNEKINIDPKFNETACFLAGKEFSKKSNLYQYSKTKEYTAYSNKIGSAWSKLQEFNAKKITAWREKHLPEKYTNLIYYPFAGPDILNMLLFFPDGSEYIMFGLESPGEIPQPQNVSHDKIISGLRGLWEALDTFLSINFFKTKEMAKEISTNAFNSITSVMMFSLGRMNYEVLEVKKIWLDEKGIIITIKPEKKSNRIIPGSEIVFREAPGTPVKKVFYYQIDVSESSLNNHQNFISYLKSRGRCTTIIKCASYLMHRDKEFRLIRDLTLSQSDYLLQDDSGIPLNYFSPDEWKLSFHGAYAKPIDLFAERYQGDFRQAMAKYSSGPLPFAYGYSIKEHKPNLMFAERIKK